MAMKGEAAPELTIEQLEEGTAVTFDASREISIGRDRGSDVVVAHDRASRRHASLHFEPAAGWVLEDHSSNGTFVNGARVASLVVSAPVVIYLGSATEGAALRLVPAASGVPSRDTTPRQAVPLTGVLPITPPPDPSPDPPPARRAQPDPAPPPAPPDSPPSAPPTAFSHTAGRDVVTSLHSAGPWPAARRERRKHRAVLSGPRPCGQGKHRKEQYATEP